MCQVILLDLISCGDTGKHPPDLGKNFAIKESHCKWPDAGSLTVVVFVHPLRADKPQVIRLSVILFVSLFALLAPGTKSSTNERVSDPVKF